MTAKDERYCVGCKHFESLYNGGRPYCCMYVANTGKIRPCKAGVGCTVKEKKKKGKPGRGKGIHL